MLGLAWPVAVDSILDAAVSAADLLMVARLGVSAVAGVGLAAQVIFVVSAAATAIATGTTVCVSQAAGSGNRAAAGHVVKQSLLLAALLSAALTLVGVPGARPLVARLGGQPDVVDMATTYLEVTLLGSATLIGASVLRAALRGAGDSRTPMLVGLAVNAANLLLAYVLIFGHVGLPALGVAGSALAASLARCLGLVALLALVVRPRGRVPLQVVGSGWRPDGILLWRMLRIGVPAMGEQLLRNLGFLLYATMIISLGTTAFAAQRITYNLFSLSLPPCFAFATAATALTGQALGARKLDYAPAATWTAVRTVCAWMGIVAVMFVCAAPILVRAYSADPGIVAEGALALRVLAVGLVPLGVAQVLAGGLRGSGNTRVPMFVTAASMWLVRLPATWLLATGVGWGLTGSYAAFSLAFCLEAMILWGRFRRIEWKRLVDA
jgi:putative MATE family efflux protein